MEQQSQAIQCWHASAPFEEHAVNAALGACREQWTYEKKIKKATARKERDLAERLASRRPTYRIDHLVKERWAPSGTA